MNMKLKKLLLTALVISVSFSTAIASVIQPSPRMEYNKRFYLSLNEQTKIVCDDSDPEAKEIAVFLKEELLALTKSSLDLEIIGFSSGSVPDTNRILLGKASKDSKIETRMAEKGLVLPDDPGKESYLLEVYGGEEREVIIAAKEHNGVFYGVTTLLQLVNEIQTDEGKKFSIEGYSIKDFLYTKNRIVHAIEKETPITFDPTNANDFNVFNGELSESKKEAIDEVAKMKYNQIFLNYNDENWIIGTPKIFEAYQAYKAYCEKRYIKVRVGLKNPKLGTAGGRPWSKFAHLEGWYVEDEPFVLDAETGSYKPEFPPTNLFSKGNFESGINDWTFSSKPSASNPSVETSDEISGEIGGKCLKLEGFNQTAQIDIKIDPSDKVEYYLLRTWAKGGAIEKFRMKRKDAQGKSIDLPWSERDYWDALPNWEQRWCAFSVDDPNITQLTVFIKTIPKDSENPNQATPIAYFDNIELLRVNGALKNVIRDNEGGESHDTDIVVKDAATENRLTLGTDYDVADGDTQLEFDSKKLNPFVIKAPSNASSPPAKINVSYDFVMNLSKRKQWLQPLCMGDPDVINLYKKGIDNVNTYMGGQEVIHFHIDELRGMGRDSRSKRLGENENNSWGGTAEIMRHFIKETYDYLKEVSPKTEYEIFDDMVNPYRFNGGSPEFEYQYGVEKDRGRGAEAIENGLLPKDIGITVWDYYEKGNTTPWLDRTLNYFGEHGYKNLHVAPGMDSLSYKDFSEMSTRMNPRFSKIDTLYYMTYENETAHMRDAANMFWNPGKEILFYDSFEDSDKADAERPEGWEMTGGAFYDRDQANDFGYYWIGDGPDSSVKIQGAGKILGPFISIRPEEHYSCKVQTKGNGGLKARMQILFYDAAKKPLESLIDAEYLSETSYAEHSVLFDAPEDASYARVQLMSDGGNYNYGGTLWFDDVVFYRVYEDEEGSEKIDISADEASDQASFSPWVDKGDYIVVPNGTGDANKDEVTSTDGRGVYTFELSEKSDVTLEALVRFANGDDNSFWYRIDDTEWRVRNYETVPSWTWITLDSYGGLAPGRHYLEIASREDGAQIAGFRFIASTNQLLDPGGKIQTLIIQANEAAGQFHFHPWVDKGDYIVVPNGKGDDNHREVNYANGKAVYGFELGDVADITVEARVRFPNGNDNSFWYRIDDTQWKLRSQEVLPSWTWITLHTYKGLSPGNHLLEIANREDGSEISQFRVIALANKPAVSSGTLTIQANEAAGQDNFSPWEVYEEEDKGDYIVVPNGKGDDNKDMVVSEEGRLVYDFELTEASYVTLEAEVRFPTERDNSFWYQIDETGWRRVNGKAVSSWTWIPLGVYGGLLPGGHRLEIANREDGAEILQFRLITSASRLLQPGEFVRTLEISKGEKNKGFIGYHFNLTAYEQLNVIVQVQISLPDGTNDGLGFYYNDGLAFYYTMGDSQGNTWTGSLDDSGIWITLPVVYRGADDIPGLHNNPGLFDSKKFGILATGDDQTFKISPYPGTKISKIRLLIFPK